MSHGEYHVTPFSTYVKVLATLLALTVVTVIASRFDFGFLNTVIAMFIATVKAGTVMLFFMHLKYDNNVNRVIFGLGFFFLLVLFAFSIVDIYTRVNWTPQ